MIKEIYERHSVRKFTEEAVKKEDLLAMLEAAAQAPSAKNQQNWHFTVVTNKDMIAKLAEAVARKNEEIALTIEDEKKQSNFRKFLRFADFFKGAPCLVLVYDKFVSNEGYDEMVKAGYSKEETENLSGVACHMQGIGAAIENFCLTATHLGYGTTWMTSSTYAAKEIEAVLPVGKEGFTLSALLPVGRPDGEVKFPQRMAVEEISTFVE